MPSCGSKNPRVTSGFASRAEMSGGTLGFIRRRMLQILWLKRASYSADLNRPESSYCLATRWPFAVFLLLNRELHRWTSQEQRRGAESYSGSQKMSQSPLVYGGHAFYCIQRCTIDSCCRCLSSICLHEIGWPGKVWHHPSEGRGGETLECSAELLSLCQ